jgi:3-oxoacyl-[acyl-carrier protein] reductase
MRLKDRIALVTGGGRGIGRGIVKAFAAEGAKVAVVYRGSQGPAEELVDDIKKAGGSAVAFQADVADHASVTVCVEKVEKELGPIDILVNNAGVIEDDLFVRLDPERWNKVLQTNLGGTYNFCQAIAYSMMKRRSGRIINISSVAASHVNPGQTNYAASKGAINSFTRALAVELASRGVTVNARLHRDRHERRRPQQGRRHHQEDDSDAPPRHAGGHRQGGGVSGQRRQRVCDGTSAYCGRRLELGSSGSWLIRRWRLSGLAQPPAAGIVFPFP